MLAIKLLVAAAIATFAQGFELCRDENGYAVLPPTSLVEQFLASKSPEYNPDDYHVLNTVSDIDGEIIRVNLNTHEQQKTGKYRENHNPEAYYSNNKNSARTIYNSDHQCFNQEDEFEVSECTFDFDKYDSPGNCSSGAQYSCVLDVEKSQDSQTKLKDMEKVPALVKCYKDVKQAISDDAKGGACGK